MKELTRKQKIDFLVYCMNEIACQQRLGSNEASVFVCNELYEFIENADSCIELFPELLLFSRDKKVIKYYELTSSVKDDNATRAIILSFIYNML